MKRRLLQLTILAGAVGLVPPPAAAQFPPPPAPSGSSTVQDRWPSADLPPAPPPQSQPQQSAPRQTQQPAAAPRPSKPPPARQARPADDDAPAKPAPKPRAAAAAPANTVTCGGTFAKNTSHLKLARQYDSRNIAFDDVEGPDGNKIKGSILFPNDPRRRLEVIWKNDTARTDLSMVVINGQSQWASPKGVKLGTSLAALEKLNGRPFKLTGFDADGSASVLAWQGGALGSVPGGCRIGIRLTGNAGSGDKELLSNDPSLKSAAGSVAEILIGF